MKQLSIGKLEAIWFFFFYAIISEALFTYTSSGWTALIYFFLFGSIFYSLIFIGFISISFLPHTQFYFFKKDILILLIMQIAALLFNTGDCGGRRVIFIERLPNLNQDACAISTGSEPFMGSFVSWLIIFVYMFYLVKIIFGWQSREKFQKSKNNL